LYEDLNEQKIVVLPFIKGGLQKDQYCLFVTSDQSVDDWSLELQAFGVDVKREIERGALTIATGEQLRGSTDFNSIVKARELWRLVEGKLSGFTGVRIIGDAEWALIEPALPSERLCHWEATADLLYKGEPVTTICMYDMRRHSPSDIRAALRTHAHAQVAGMRYVNPFYEAANILDNEPHLNPSDADGQMVASMLDKLKSVQGS
jgi:hypothetical protein